MTETYFLGEPIRFWIELKRWHECRDVDAPSRARLMKEIGDLRAKVSFYESRIQDMNEFMNQETR